MSDAPPKKKTKMSDAEEVQFSLKVMINKEKTKVLFAEADSHFVDILLSFLTLPLGRIMKLLEKHYGDETPSIGSLTTLYRSLANLDTAHFWTEGAKMALLDPTSSFEAEYQQLKLDICDYQPGEYFACRVNSSHARVRSVSMYYDRTIYCPNCRTYQHSNCKMYKEVGEKGSQVAASKGVFTTHTTSFLISDDLHIFPSETGILGVISILRITDMDHAEPIQVTVGFSEIMNLLKSSLISQTPLSDLILNKTRQINSVIVGSEPVTQIGNEETPNPEKMILKVMIQKSTGKLLYAQAKEDFIDFLFSLLNIPLGGVEHLLAGKTCFKAIKNLYRSTSESIEDKYFKTPDTKNRLIKPNVPHGCVSENHILPLTEENLPAEYFDLKSLSSVKFPNGQGKYIEGPGTYQVADDLTVAPFCTLSIMSSLNKLKIPLSDVKEVQLQIGLKEGLGILKASLTSTSALTDGLLLNHLSFKQPKPEL